MAAAAVHRHTPEGYAGVQRREGVVASGVAAEPVARETAAVAVAAGPSETVATTETVSSGNALDVDDLPHALDENGGAPGTSASHAVVPDVDDERVAADPAHPAVAQASKRPALSLGLPADILALDLNLGEEPASARMPAPASHAEHMVPPATGTVDPDRHR